MRMLPISILLTSGLVVHSQAPAPAAKPAPEPSVGTALDGTYQWVPGQFISAAEAMPEEKYGFRLTPAQRTFGEWITHTASGLYGYCSAIRGEGRPEAAKHLEEGKTKAERSRGIKEAFAYCDAALKATSDQQLLDSPNRVRGAINLIASPNEHYGNIVGYLRASGLVPPSTQREQAEKARKR